MIPPLMSTFTLQSRLLTDEIVSEILLSDMASMSSWLDVMFASNSLSDSKRGFESLSSWYPESSSDTGMIERHVWHLLVGAALLNCCHLVLGSIDVSLMCNV